MEATQQTSTPEAGRDLPKVLRNAATRSTIDDVTTLFSPIGGRTRATLSFRVGTADEPLHLRGISHLIGHLASAAADQDDAACPVTVSASTLSMHFVGNALAVANEIGAVCHWITTASGARADERALERAKAAARADQRIHAPEHLILLRHRYGPRGWAAGGYREHALDALTADDVRSWVAEHLNAQNAVLALSGTKATTLRVPLPRGEYRPLPGLPEHLLDTPALLRADEPRLSLSGVVGTDPNRLDRDRAAAGLTTEIARSRVAYALGRRYGRELTVKGSPMTLGSTAVHAVVHAEVDADREAKVADIAAESLDVLCERGLVDGELAAHVKRRLALYERASASHAGAHELLHRQAIGALNDTPWSLALERRMLSVTDEQLIAEQLRSIAGTKVLSMRPVDPPVRPWPGPPPPRGFEAHGEVFRSRPAYGLSSRTTRPARLIVGEQGATLRSADRPDEQLAWDTVVMTQVWDDGRQLLTGHAGSTLDIRPEQWLAPDLIRPAVTTRLPDDVSIVAMGERDCPPPAPLRVTDRVAPAWWWAGVAAGVVMVVVGALPVWPAGAAWARWLLAAAGVVLAVLAGSWAADTALTERRLRRPGGSHRDDGGKEQPPPGTR